MMPPSVYHGKPPGITRHFTVQQTPPGKGLLARHILPVDGGGLKHVVEYCYQTSIPGVQNADNNTTWVEYFQYRGNTLVHWEPFDAPTWKFEVGSIAIINGHNIELYGVMHNYLETGAAHAAGQAFSDPFIIEGVYTPLNMSGSLNIIRPTPGHRTFSGDVPEVFADDIEWAAVNQVMSGIGNERLGVAQLDNRLRSALEFGRLLKRLAGG